MATEIMPAGMGRCEITGQIVPEDELVTISNQRVSAEGKAILLDRLKAGEAMPGEMERPTVMRRFGCYFLDGIIVGVPIAIVNIVFAMAGMAVGAVAGGGPRVMTAAMAVGPFIGTTLSVAYFGFMHGLKGRTLGKMAGKLKVVRMDGKPMDLSTGFIRALAYQGFSYLTVLSLLIASGSLYAISLVIVGVYGLANAVSALVDTREQRALHDRIAGTRVIMAEK